MRLNPKGVSNDFSHQLCAHYSCAYFFGDTISVAPTFANTKAHVVEKTKWEQAVERNQARIDELKKKRAVKLSKHKEELEENKAAKQAEKKAGEEKAKEASKKKEAKKTKQAKKGKFDALIAKYASKHGVPQKLARAVVQVESSFRPNVTGAAGEIGLMQIKFTTAKGMGYKGSRKQLYDPATNLNWGMKYLGRAHELAGGTTCGTILKYNAGHYAKRKNKTSTRYCQIVLKII